MNPEREDGTIAGSVEKFDADYWVEHPKEFVEKVDSLSGRIRVLENAVYRVRKQLSSHSHQDGKVVIPIKRVI